MDKIISLYIVEDYLLARITCKKALEQFPDLKINGAFETAEECLEALERESVDVILMDIGLPYMTGIEATKIIKEKYSNAKVIMLTSHDNQEEIISSLASGANAYALKDIDIEDLHNLFQCILKNYFNTLSFVLNPKLLYQSLWGCKENDSIIKINKFC